MHVYDTLTHKDVVARHQDRLKEIEARLLMLRIDRLTPSFAVPVGVPPVDYAEAMGKTEDEIKAAQIDWMIAEVEKERDALKREIAALESKLPKV